MTTTPDAPAIAFTTGAIPKAARPNVEREPNPFTRSPILAWIVAHKGDPENGSATFSVIRPNTEDGDKALSRKIRRQLNEAGSVFTDADGKNITPVTVKSKIELTGTAKAPTMTFTVWAINKITPKPRTPKPEGDAAA